MTPAIRAAERAEVAFTVHPYEHDPAAESYGLEAAAALGVEPGRMFKTLVAELEGKSLVLALVPVAARLDLKRLAAALGAKRAEMATPVAAERATGCVVGGISPLATRKALPAALDETALTFPTVFVSAGKRGLQLEMAPQDLVRLTKAVVAPLSVR